MRNLIIVIFISLSSIFFGQINFYLKKGNRALDQNKLEKAKNCFQKAYNLDKENYNANLELGLILSDYLNKYEVAIPYLETALLKSKVDTFPDLIYSLAKCYQHKGDNEKAEALFSKLSVVNSQDKEQDINNSNDLKKRIEDCKFALANTDNNYNNTIYVGNLGLNVNTEFPEYVPVLDNENILIFTSRRKDSKKEKKSKIDDMYFENMYVSQLNNGRPGPVTTYSLTSTLLKTNHKKRHISIISANNNCKAMFLFQNNKIYQVTEDANHQKSSHALSKHVNMDFYQNHASISKDGNTLFFTSEDMHGFGGLDIYKTVKDEKGAWGIPENLGANINTSFDEDSPFISDDGQTLYFSSKGHPGFGNFDIYKSTCINGQWSTPQNLELPVNSTGHDIFFIESDKNTHAYLSSNRTGGHGDMDLYKITYLNNWNKECLDINNSLLSIDAKIINKDSLLVKFETILPGNLKPISYDWHFNNENLNVNYPQFKHSVALKSASDSIHLKVIAGCDTCIDPIVLCGNLIYKLPAMESQPIVNVEEIGKNPYDDKLNLLYLNKTKLEKLGFNLTPIHFNVNKSNVRKDAMDILNQNIQVLVNHPELSVLIYGFSDSRGLELYNLELSSNRAQHVNDYLINKGVLKSQIKQVTGKGETFMLNECSANVKCTDAEHELNRRVEFIIFDNNK